MRSILTKSVFTLLIMLTGIVTINAQFDGGGDLASRYLWRGQLLSSGPVIQPWVSYSTSSESASFEIGAWGSYSFATTLHPDGTLTDGSEADLYFSVGVGDFSFGLTDYFFPSDEAFAVNDNYFDYGNHVFELNLGYDGPVSIAFNYNISGDPGADGQDLNSIYTEFGFGVADNVDLITAFGNGWYTDDEGFGMVGLGITVSKELTITESFALPVFATVLVNPAIEKIFIVFGMSF